MICPYFGEDLISLLIQRGNQSIFEADQNSSDRPHPNLLNQVITISQNTL
jgi:hypothetical protein